MGFFLHLQIVGGFPEKGGLRSVLINKMQLLGLLDGMEVKDLLWCCVNNEGDAIMLDNVYYSKVLKIEWKHFSNDIQCSGIQYSMSIIEARALLLWFGLDESLFL